MRVSFVFLFAALVGATSVQADPLDDAIVAEMKRGKVPGLGIAVVKDGKIVKEMGYGDADVENGVRVTPQTVFQSGSVGKTFTAALVMLLAEDGKLSLDDPISRHLAKTPRAWQKITIRHLLTHTSGLGDPYAKLDMRKDYTDEELIALEAAIPVLSAPGEKWSYSNMGYHLLGFICNKVGGKFYGDQLRERIFAPLGMSTRVISESDIIPHRARGYERIDGVLKNQQWVAPRLNTTADGSLYLTARDLALWDLALYDDKILNARVREASWTPAKLNDGKTAQYGLGWQLDSRNGHRVIGHGGAWQGFKADFVRYVDDKLTVVVLANSAAARPNRFADLIAAHYEPALARKLAVAIAETEPAVNTRVRELVEQLAGGVLPAGLDASVNKQFSPAFLKMLASEGREWGAVQSVEALARETEGEKRRYRYRVNYADTAVLVNIGFGKDGVVDVLKLRLE
ncbi:beta-lactamase family protein [Massilia atriviolacea]|uniref:Class A beta-lactamase-related serine hydrolase n=1 Tax=Massilia atriviolacea TaxID=2495579 RepID=A0A430HTR7_9BURK|nr:serine hydrolase domain-containing protein [Massilia atriviolacea]RSZ60961.1 class A beta-lactamase-related serine hydrolase [Massilia atriviolacea]